MRRAIQWAELFALSGVLLLMIQVSWRDSVFEKRVKAQLINDGYRDPILSGRCYFYSAFDADGNLVEAYGGVRP